MNIKIVTLVSILFSSNLLFAHGMNKLGPNGGFIKMPGAFHTELVDSGETMKIYLLDMNFKNPETKNSSVKIKYQGVGVKSEYVCTKNSSYFECEKPKKGFKNILELKILAVRNNIKASEAVYSLPLRLER